MKRLFLVSALVVAAHAKPVMAQQEARELVPTASKGAAIWLGELPQNQMGDSAFITQLDAYMGIQQTTHA